jgi:hypothetical protein
LKEGLLTAKGEFIVILMLILFLKDWLYKTIPYFKIQVVVQTRWGHLNRNYSIDKIQAFALDAHFTLEQVGLLNCILSILMELPGMEKAMYSRCGNWEVIPLRRLRFKLSRSVKSFQISRKCRYLLNFAIKCHVPNNLDGTKVAPKISAKTRFEYYNQNLLGSRQSSWNVAFIE